MEGIAIRERDGHRCEIGSRFTGGQRQQGAAGDGIAGPVYKNGSVSTMPLARHSVEAICYRKCRWREEVDLGRGDGAGWTTLAHPERARNGGMVGLALIFADVVARVACRMAHERIPSFESIVGGDATAVGVGNREIVVRTDIVECEPTVAVSEVISSSEFL